MKTSLLTAALLSALALPAFAQENAHAAHDHTAMQMQMQDDDEDTAERSAAESADDAGQATSGHAGMHHATMQHDPSETPAMNGAGMDHSSMDHSAMGHSAMDHAAMANAATASQQPVPEPTAADRAAAFPELHLHSAHSPALNSYVLLDRLEGWDRDSGSGQAWEANAWIGGDIDRLWLRSEGEREGGRTQDSELEALYGHAISPWWDLLAGVRQQFRPEGSTWAAVGVQGLAPYKFEFAATLYLGEGGAGMLRLNSEYDLLLSNRLILQPSIETTFALDDDAATRSDGDSLEAGLRLRYEINRRFAPYIGWEHQRRFGDGADAARAHGEAVRESRFVAGVRVWF